MPETIKPLKQSHSPKSLCILMDKITGTDLETKDSIAQMKSLNSIHALVNK